MPPPRRRSRTRRQTATYLSMALTLIAAFAIVGVLAYTVLPARADPDAPRPKGTKIAVPTAISEVAIVETEVIEPPARTDSTINRELGLVPTETLVSIAPTPTVRVIRRPKAISEATASATPSNSIVLKAASTAIVGRTVIANPPLKTQIVEFPTLQAATLPPQPSVTRSPSRTPAAIANLTSTAMPIPTATDTPTPTPTRTSVVIIITIFPSATPTPATSSVPSQEPTIEIPTSTPTHEAKPTDSPTFDSPPPTETSANVPSPTAGSTTPVRTTPPSGTVTPSGSATATPTSTNSPPTPIPSTTELPMSKSDSGTPGS